MKTYLDELNNQRSSKSILEQRAEWVGPKEFHTPPGMRFALPRDAELEEDTSDVDRAKRKLITFRHRHPVIHDNLHSLSSGHDGRQVPLEQWHPTKIQEDRVVTCGDPREGENSHVKPPRGACLCRRCLRCSRTGSGKGNAKRQERRSACQDHVYPRNYPRTVHQLYQGCGHCHHGLCALTRLLILSARYSGQYSAVVRYLSSGCRD